MNSPMNGAMNGPMNVPRLLAAQAMADVVEAGPTQAAARRQEREGFQEIGLAGAVAAHQDHRLEAAVEPELAVIAEIGEAKLTDGQH